MVQNGGIGLLQEDNQIHKLQITVMEIAKHLSAIIRRMLIGKVVPDFVCVL